MHCCAKSNKKNKDKGLRFRGVSQMIFKMAQKIKHKAGLKTWN
jgi:hypothetical protein